jgi:hypothetical protein
LAPGGAGAAKRADAADRRTDQWHGTEPLTTLLTKLGLCHFLSAGSSQIQAAYMAAQPTAVWLPTVVMISAWQRKWLASLGKPGSPSRARLRFLGAPTD